MPKRVLVTGGAGFIGSHLTEELVSMGYQVTVLDNLKFGNIENIKAVTPNIQFVKGDIRNASVVYQLVEKTDIIFHLAANASVPYSVEHPTYDFETNAVGTFNILEAARQSKKIEKIIYASSAGVYGEAKYVPMDENHPLQPISPYGASKLAGEKLGFAYKNTYGLPFVAVRIFNVYGPRQPRYVIYDFIKKLKSNPKQLQVLGSGEQVRSFCYIEDAVKGLILIMEKGVDVYNLSGENPISIRELAYLIAKQISPQAELVFGEKPWKGDINILIGDLSKLKDIGFKPKVDLQTGLSLTIEWFENYEK